MKLGAFTGTFVGITLYNPFRLNEKAFTCRLLPFPFASIV